MGQIIGWVGTFLILLGYGLNVSGVVLSDSIYYLIINLFGAIFLGIAVYIKKSWPNLFLEIVWFAIAVFGIIKAIL